MSNGNIRRLIEQFASDLEAEIRGEFQDRLRQLAGEMVPEEKARTKGAEGKRTKQKRSMPPRCVHPGCEQPHCGPKYHFLCRKHKDQPIEQEGKSK